MKSRIVCVREWEWEREREMRKWGRTNEESAGKGPLLCATDNGEREPMGGNEGMQQRNRGYSSDGRQIFGAETFHYTHAKRATISFKNLRCLLLLARRFQGSNSLPSTPFSRSISPTGAHLHRNLASCFLLENVTFLLSLFRPFILWRAGVKRSL